MSNRRWSQEEKDYLRDNVGKKPHAQIANDLGLSVSVVKAAASRYKYSFRHQWSDNEIQLLQGQYPHIKTEKIAQMLGLPLHAVYNKAHALKLYKTEEFLKSEESGWLTKFNCHKGAATRFKKGDLPANKGKKMPYNAASAATQFKKGNLPKNHVPVGTEVVSSDGYRKIKVAEPNVWEYIHRSTWIAANGPIPKGQIIRFKDGDPLNCDLSNLVICSRTENVLMNSIHKYPPEIVPALSALAELKKEIKNAEK
jgi:HNH endonuclease